MLGAANKILLARLLGPTYWGIYTILLKICNIAEILSLLGTNTVILKLLGTAVGSGDWGRLKGTLTGIFRIIIVSSSAVAFIIYWSGDLIAIRFFHSRELYAVLVWGAVALPLRNCLLITVEAFRGLQDLKTASFLPVLQQVVFLMSLIFLHYNALASIHNALIAFFAGILCPLLAGLMILYHRTAPWPSEKISPAGILRESLPMVVTRGSLLIMSNMDFYVLGLYAEPAEVGIYGVVSTLAATVVFPLNIFNQVIPAMLAHYNAQNDYQRLAYVVRFASTLGTMFSAPIFILLMLFDKHMLNLYFGYHYSSGTGALYFLIAGQLVNSITGSCGYMLQMTGLHKLFMKISLTCGIINLILDFFMVRHFGKEGIAAATAFSLATQNILTMVVVYRKTGIWTMVSPKLLSDIAKQAGKYICY